MTILSDAPLDGPASEEPSRTITVSVNGSDHRCTVPTRELLSDFLRHRVGLTGTHVGCEQGSCGACTVVVDGTAIRSCLMFAVQADGAAVETVEALAADGELAGLQQHVRDCHGLQCGFCTPGILMSLAAARRNGLGVDAVQTDVLGGHICRCTGYVGLREAIRMEWEVNP
jgi:aerobic-type carbon monoxide dehydrogenase small subunit (CoxS/CutS family)